MHTYVIVDDEKVIREGLRVKVGQTCGREVVCVGEASNGIGALELMREVKPDFVITDMKMNRMDGVTLLEKLNRGYPDTPIIVISGYKLFDYVKQAIEKHAVGYVLKPFSAEEIAEQVHKAVQILDEKEHVRLLQQKIRLFEHRKDESVLCRAIAQPWNQEIEKRLGENNYLSTDECLLLTVTTEDFGMRAEVDRKCKALMRDDLCSVFSQESTQWQFHILFHMPGGRKNWPAKSVEELLRQIESLAASGSAKVFVCVSRRAGSLRKLHELYLENEALLENAFLTDRFRILTAADRKEIRPVIEKDGIHEFVLDMKYHTAKINEDMDLFFSMFYIREHPAGVIFNACRELLEQVNECAVKHRIETRDLTQRFYSRYLLKGGTVELKTDITAYIREVFGSIQRNRSGQADLFDQMLDYIDRHYQEKLTLQRLADHFYASSAFCSNLLKENLNMTFNDYLSKIRLQNAKRLLDKTELSVRKISDEVGYSNPKYFFKVFKKATGCTPQKYRFH